MIKQISWPGLSAHLFEVTGICQDKVSASDLVDKVGQSSINWSAGYIEAVGIGAPPEKMAGKINARPIALRAAQADALRNLLEITKGVQVDSSTSVKDFTVESDVIDTQVNGLAKSSPGFSGADLANLVKDAPDHGFKIISGRINRTPKQHFNAHNTIS